MDYAALPTEEPSWHWAEPVGAAEGNLPYASLVLLVNREAIQHLAEVAVIRDLYQGMR